ncbi:MAG: CHASE2 domain-containing protein [Oscillatoriales cyanobacterium C42_A2020_001]|nr:CHASE2 domain-containing protein [Leptolyngbyaceae cyanobacterium C42_A2020_001]
MAKVIVLKFGKGSFEQGFPVILQMSAENTLPFAEITGELPAAPDLPDCYRQWQTAYRRVEFTGRPIGLPKTTQLKGTIAECETLANQLRDRLNAWLTAESFRRIREKWLEQLSPTEPIRVVIQADDPHLRRLPWNEWELLERYPQAEIALSPLDFGRRTAQASPTTRVRILAILGNSQGIDVQKDCALLEQLDTADVTFLVEPERQNLSDRLWEQSWEILFFAGHSTSQTGDRTGLIHLNQTETLSLSQLKHALEKAVDRGLKLAIFNSCDGLGLARELASLQIPQLIVMREPVPDRVAEAFLKYFLAAYASGEPLYLAVRQARERLQGLENQFPCASWLPVICQHPAEIPPTWLDLRQAKRPAQPPISTSKFRLRVEHVPPKLAWVATISLIMTGLLTGVRYLGGLQPLELRTFDQLLQMRPKEPKDQRLLVIEITEKDLQDQRQRDPQMPPDVSLSDRALDQLLATLEPLQPRAIGLDIYRDYPTSPAFPQLEKRLKTSDRLIVVCKMGTPNTADFGIKPPPELPPQQALERLGLSNVITDQDGAVRRHLLGMEPDAVCITDAALSVQLALRYLAAEGISLTFTPDGNWQLGKTLIKPIEFPTGGYFQIDGRGHQILLNYRSPDNASSFHTPEDVAPRLSLGAALLGGLTLDAVKDKIVLIGTTARNNQFNDYFSTPYRNEQSNVRQIPGVMLHAQMTSQLISAVLDGRSLLWTLPVFWEILWILGWSLLGGLLAFYLQKAVVLGVASGVAIAALYGLCLGLLIQTGCWLPLVPAVIGCVGSTTGVIVSQIRIAQKPLLASPRQE